MHTRTPRLAGLAVLGGALLLPALVVPPAGAAGPSGAAPKAKARTEAVGGELLGLPGTHVRPTSSKARPLPSSGAKSWVVADAGTGEVLAAHNAHARRLPASTLKTLTAVTLIPRLDPDASYTATWADASIEGSKVGIVQGAPYTVDQLLRGLMLASGNDAARALAGANGGMARTVRMMNEEAARLGAADTVVRNTSGLDHPEQLSSAYDLALIARAGLAMPRFREYSSMISTTFPGGKAKKGKKRTSFMVYNHNPLLRQQYRGAIGVKNGFTVAARRTFVGAAERGGRTLIVSLMGYGTDTYTEAANLLDWGFSSAKHVEPVGVLVDPVDVESGDLDGDGDKDTDETGELSADDAVKTAGGGTPAWPFVLVGTPLALLALGAVASSMRSNDPLAAANRGTGRRRGRGYGSGPRRY